jgi:hypothetical protein
VHQRDRGKQQRRAEDRTRGNVVGSGAAADDRDDRDQRVGKRGAIAARTLPEEPGHVAVTLTRTALAVTPPLPAWLGRAACVCGAFRSSGVAERVPGAEADGAAHGKEEHEQCQHDRPDECDEDVQGREDDR